MKRGSIIQCRFLFLSAMLISLNVTAEVFRWVDEQGQVHFGDKPPEEAEVEMLEIDPGPSEAEVKEAQEVLLETLEKRKREDASASEAREQDEREQASRELQESARFEACVEALQQLEILKRQVRVFRLGPGWSRAYLENEERPAEIDRQRALVNANCSGDEDSVKEQIRGAIVLNRALGIRCLNAREKLAGEIEDSTREEYESYLDESCPDIDYSGLWIADWIHR